jgi:hypothetical protein
MIKKDRKMSKSPPKDFDYKSGFKVAKMAVSVVIKSVSDM